MYLDCRHRHLCPSVWLVPPRVDRRQAARDLSRIFDYRARRVQALLSWKIEPGFAADKSFFNAKVVSHREKYAPKQHRSDQVAIYRSMLARFGRAILTGVEQ